SFILSCMLVFNQGDYGVLGAVIITGMAGAAATNLLTGFGSPNGNGREATLAELRNAVVFSAVFGFLVFYAINLLLRLLMKQEISPALTLLWGAGLLAVTGYRVGKNIYLNANKRWIRVVVGYDDELSLEYRDVYVSIKSDKHDESISFNGAAYSREVNDIGFRRSMDGDKTIYYRPDKIRFSLLGSHATWIPADIDFLHLTLYVNKCFDLSVYFDDQLVKTIPAQEWQIPQT
ncbi:MAG: hypothetical protein OEY07_19330, partial [Gammaproteobacteria bacterium]|nr:hypothetical protein [Gammaproteobacteria bacterium]